MLLKAVVFLLLAVFISKLSFAQDFKAQYRFYHEYDTVGKLSKSEPMLLHVHQGLALYRSYHKVLSDSLLQAAKESGNTTIPQTPKYSFEQWLTNVENSTSITFVPWISDTLLIKKESSVIQWELINEDSTILGIQCKKAMAHVGGRIYMAWYSPQIPSWAGPWRLNGLPGLIISAKDQSGTVWFEMQELVWENTQWLHAGLLKNAKPSSRKEFARIIHALKSNPQSIYGLYNTGPTTYTTPDGGTVKKEFIILNRDGSRMQFPSAQKTVLVNNPLELTTD